MKVFYVRVYTYIYIYTYPTLDYRTFKDTICFEVTMIWEDVILTLIVHTFLASERENRCLRFFN